MTDIPALHFSAAVEGLSMATGASPESIALACASILGGIAGPDARLLGPHGALLAKPGCNALILGFDDAKWMAAESLLLEPVEACTRQMRRLSQTVDPRRLDQAQSNVSGTPLNLHPGKAILESLEIVMRNPEDEIAKNRAVQVLREPSFTLRSPTAETFASGADEVNDGMGLAYYPGGSLFPKLCDRKEDRKWGSLASHLVDAVVGADHVFKPKVIGASRMRSLGTTLYGSAGLKQLDAAIGGRRGPVQQLLEQSWVVAPQLNACRPNEIDAHLIEDGCRRYWETVEEVFGFRRAGKGVSFKLRAEDYEELIEGIQTLQARIDFDIQPDYVAYTRHWRTLPAKLLWTLYALAGEYESGEGLVGTALYLTQWTVTNHVQTLRGILEAEVQRKEKLSREAMLAKLTSGPQTPRQLMRRCSVQRWDVHAPVLQSLIRDRLVLQDSEDRYFLAQPFEPGSLLS